MFGCSFSNAATSATQLARAAGWVVGGSQSTEILTGPVSAAVGPPLFELLLLHEAAAASASPAMARVATLRVLKGSSWVCAGRHVGADCAQRTERNTREQEVDEESAKT